MNPTPKHSTAYPLFFLGIGLLFIGIMVYVYLGSRKANPELLNEKGQRTTAQHS